MTLFTLCNPGIHAGGFVRESKCDILNGFKSGRNQLARYCSLPAEWSFSERLEAVSACMREMGLSYPVVLKPDSGEWGAGVVIAKSEQHVRAFLAATPQTAILQEYVPGVEFGVFYVRRPGKAFGVVSSITDKQFPRVIGDGQRTLETLILDDDRAVCLAHVHLDRHADVLLDVPKPGEIIQLVELGTHSKGSLFLDGSHLQTPELEAAIDRLSKGFEGFYLGRYDIRVPSVDDFQAGQNLKVVELNGVTSEPTDMYDPGNSVFKAYRKLMKQWKTAFEIGADIRRKGLTPLALSDLFHLVVGRP